MEMVIERRKKVSVPMGRGVVHKGEK